MQPQIIEVMNYVIHLNIDLIGVISEYLPIKDIYNLVSIFDPNNDNILHNIIMNKIFNKLSSKIKNKDYMHIMNFMKKTNFCISGSFILQCILNTEYNTDIDFFGSSKYVNVVKKLLKDLKIEKNLEVEYECYGGVNLFRPHFTVMTSYYYTKFIDKEVYSELALVKDNEYEKFFEPRTSEPRTSESSESSESSDEETERPCKLKIQFVLLDVENPSDHIVNNFDLDIISNYLTYESGKWKLYIENIKGISNKFMKVKLAPDDEKLRFDRIDKYQERGFRFNNIDDLLYIEKRIGNNNRIYTCNNEATLINIKSKKEYMRLHGINTPCNENCYIKKFFDKGFYKHIHIIPKRILKSKNFPGYGIVGNYEHDNIISLHNTDIIVYTQ